MRKYILYFILTLVTELVAAAPSAIPHLYELKNKKKTLYLLGTMHAGVSLSEYPSSILNFIDSSDLILFEKAFTRDVVNSISNDYLGFMSNNLKSEQISEATLLPRTRASLIQYGIPESLVDNIDSKNCSIFIGIRFHLNNPGLDLQILKYAYERGKSIDELDSEILREEANELDEDQGSAASCDFNEIFRTYTVKQIHNWENGRIQEYKSGDSSKIYSDGEAYDPGVAHRNKAWVESILNIPIEGKYFIAVGAMHLYSSEGMLKLLEEVGFSIKRLDLY